jgi:hypothetical protein
MLERLTVAYVVKKISAPYWVSRFIVWFGRVHKSTMPSASAHPQIAFNIVQLAHIRNTTKYCGRGRNRSLDCYIFSARLNKKNWFWNSVCVCVCICVRASR